MMKKRNITVIMITLLLSSSAVAANFSDTGTSVRAGGMANAYSALAEGPVAAYYNPAGIIKTKAGLFTTSYSRLFWGLTDESSLGRGFIGYSFSIMDRYGIGVGWKSFMLTNYYYENTYNLAFAYEIQDEITAGINFKMFDKQYRKNAYTEVSVDLETAELIPTVNPVFENGYTKSSFTLDVGGIYRFDKKNHVSLAIRNIIPADMALASDDSDTVPLGYKIGYGYRLSNFDTLIDVDYAGDDFNIGSGIEKWMREDTVALRGGIALGSRDYRSLTVGASYKYKDSLLINYACDYPISGIKHTFGTQMFELTICFDELIKVGEKAEEIVITEEKEGAAQQLLDLGEKAFNEGYFERAIIYFKKAHYVNPKIKVEMKEKIKQCRSMEKVKDNLMERMKKIYLKGVYAFNRKDYNTALPYLNEVIKEDDRGWEDLKKLARRALEKFNQMKEERDKYILKLMEGAEYYFERLEYKKSVEEWDKVLIFIPDDPTAKEGRKKAESKLIQMYYSNAMWFYLEEEYDEALKEFGKIISIDSGHHPTIEMINKIMKER
ncbi:type IX secretion system membrane protein PorP/SprF [Elusimicrobiota bacterium]